MRDLLLKIRLSDAEAALYEGRNAMVVPVSDDEANELRRGVAGVMEFLTFQQTCIAEVLEAIEGHEAVPTGELTKLLQAMAEPGPAVLRWQRLTGYLLVRAAFVGGDASDPKDETVGGGTPEQERKRSEDAARDGLAKHLGFKPKGPMQ